MKFEFHFLRNWKSVGTKVHGFFTFHGFKKNRPNDQLPDGLLAQLVMTSADTGAAL